MSCRHISPREEFQRELEDLNPEAAASIKKVVEQEMLQNKRRGPLHPCTPEEIEEANQVCCVFLLANLCTKHTAKNHV